MRTGVVGSGENPDLCVRPARPSDADGLSKILTQLVVAGKRRKPCNPDYALNHYIQHDHQVLCSVAMSSSGEILGFQSLKAAWVGNPIRNARRLGHHRDACSTTLDQNWRGSGIVPRNACGCARSWAGGSRRHNWSRKRRGLAVLQGDGVSTLSRFGRCSFKSFPYRMSPASPGAARRDRPPVFRHSW